MTVQKCGERARHCPMAGFVCNRASGTQDKVKWNLRHCPRGQRKMHPAARAVAQAPDSSGSSHTFFLPERKISPGRALRKQIGRASCRERGEVDVCARDLE